ncbi:MAG: bifunctional folylpolyglutamate synthase/dihydrofolate synthase [Ruminococcus flavefaciens]|nr:bifunctional folylpolyglutamate synthase/dihydrofolate synthase [Ruminococcus flavefaciens]MCM1229599.1 bifunctional folylpolyglutamate synthase/dihydrofolate synthase [Ruminococcus flavefaciens]
MMTFDECMDFVNSYSKSGKPVTDLSRAENLMRLIGNPEKKLKFVHIAGTNGKGSVVEYISNALIYSGYKVGQFTSPFVLRYTDRIRINGREIDEKSFCGICESVKQRIDGQPYSQFEITMAVAFLWYVREECDIVVLECGIGGLLDCTNVIEPPLLSVITSISLDHTAILGDTVEKIAQQKAGIIKKNSAVILSLGNKHNVKYLVKKVANEKNAEFITPENKDFKTCFSAPDNSFTYKEIQYKPAMFGFYQPMNAVTAIEACEYLRKKGFEISDEDIKKSVETTQVKARCQYIAGNPPVIVDGGHNPAGIENLEAVLRNFAVYENKNIYTVMGMVDTKDYEYGVYSIARYSEKIFTVDDFAPNAVSAQKLAELAGECAFNEACRSLSEAVEKATALAIENNGIVVICGSLYLASEYLNNYHK